MTIETAMRLAGIGQLILAAASTAIPYVLQWRKETARLPPLLRQMFWIYAGYILCFHLAFGLLSTLAPGWILDGSGLAAAVTGFIATYWGARLALQFTVFDRSDAPTGPWFRVAEGALVLLFVALTTIYAAGFAWNICR